MLDKGMFMKVKTNLINSTNKSQQTEMVEVYLCFLRRTGFYTWIVNYKKGKENYERASTQTILNHS